MASFFHELFFYTHQTNLQLAESLLEHSGRISERTVQLFSHILNAHQIWNHRIVSTGPIYEVWQIHPVAKFIDIEHSNHQQSLDLLDTQDLDSTVTYTRRGSTYQNSLSDILFHIVNHSTYHRAQIATDLRQCGIEPLVSDYILMKRNGQI